MNNISIMCKKIVGGMARGKALVTGQPINFLSMVDLRTGNITDPDHDLFNRSIKGVVLVFPNAKGSSVGAYSIYSLRANNSAPVAMVCNRVDITTASGCAIANIPVVDVLGPDFNLIKSGNDICIDADRGILQLGKQFNS